jgi:hypothetical protein
MQTLPTQFVFILGGEFPLRERVLAGALRASGVGASLAVGVGLVLLGKAVFRYSTLLPSATSVPASTELTQEAL